MKLIAATLTFALLLLQAGADAAPFFPPIFAQAPTATSGLSPKPGSAATFMRSDAAPAIDQAISPAWTGTHDFTAGLIKVPTQSGADASTYAASDAFVQNAAASVAATAANASNLTSGTVPSARLPLPTSTALGGVKAGAASVHQFLTAIGTNGALTFAQPAASDVSGLAASATSDTTNANNITSGTLPAARLPAPAAAALGGVKSSTAAAHQFMNAIDATGAPVFAQPSSDDIAGLVASATKDTTNAANITTGVLPEAQSLHSYLNPLSTPALSNTSHNGDTGGNTAVTNDPSTTVAATQHWYSGQNVLGSLVLDTVAQSATKAEQTIVARMISSTGTPGNVPSYKMAFGAETVANAGSSPAFGATIVAQYNAGYSSKNPFGTLELDMNQLSGYDCPQADEGAVGVIGCSVIGVTGVPGNKIRAGISIVGGNSILNGIQFNSGGPIANDILSYSAAQNFIADTGSHINGINLQGGTYSGTAWIGPGATSIIGSDGSYSGRAISVSFGLTGASHVANGSPLSYWALDAAASTTTVSSGAVVKLPAGRGLVLVSNNVDGNNCAFLIGNGASTLLGQVGTSCAAAAASGKVSLSYQSSTSAYSVANGLGSTAVLTIADMRNGTGN